MSWQSVRFSVALLVCIAVVCGCHTLAMGSEGPPPVLNPKTYLSRSGEYSLWVNPSDLHGRGSGSYVLSQSGKVVWSGDRPYTLWEAAVTDEGWVCGYAYTNGWRGGYRAGMGDFLVVMLDPDGKEVLNEVTPRERSRFPDTPPNPLALGLLLDEDNEQFAVRIKDADINRRNEAWWVYRLYLGDPLDRLEPKANHDGMDEISQSIAAKHVEGTPLTLVHWWRYDKVGGENQLGAVFSLVDLDGKPVWHLELPTDYNVRGDRGEQVRFNQKVRREGAILDAEGQGRFDLRFVADEKRVKFEVKRGSQGKWEVHEIGRVDYVKSKAAEPAQALSGRPKEEAHQIQFARAAGGSKGGDFAGELMASSSDCRLLAEGMESGEIRVSDLTTGKTVNQFGDSGCQVFAVAFDPDARRLVSGDANGELKIWDVESGRELASSHGHDGDVFSVYWSPDGRRIVSGGNDNLAVVSDSSSLAQLLVLRGHKSYVHSVCFNSDGTLIATASGDRTVRIWDSMRPAVRWRRVQKAHTLREQAGPLVERLLGELDDWRAVADRIRNDKSLDEGLRMQALVVLLKTASGHADPN